MRRGIRFRFTLLLAFVAPTAKGLLEICPNAWAIFFASIPLVKGASFALMNMKLLAPSLVIPWDYVYVVVPISAALMNFYSVEHIRLAVQAMREESRHDRPHPPAVRDRRRPGRAHGLRLGSATAVALLAKTDLSLGPIPQRKKEETSC